MIKHVDITIIGKVQRVGFRYSALEQAMDMGIFGFVRNQDPDAVYIEAEGEVEKLKDFLRWCHRGPEDARVTKVDYLSSEELKGFTEFIAEI
jgi:acylphosphatase